MGKRLSREGFHSAQGLAKEAVHGSDEGQGWHKAAQPKTNRRRVSEVRFFFLSLGKLLTFTLIMPLQG